MPDKSPAQPAPQPASQSPSKPETKPSPVEIYSPAARAFHWLTVVLVAVQVPVGLYMAYRGNTLNIWDATTNLLYSSHKLAGIVILALVLARIAYRVLHGAPADEPTIEPWQRLASHTTHLAIYALLVLVPVVGWIGISLFPALDVFGLFKLPGLVAANQPAAARAFQVHLLLALLLTALVAMHVGAALFHHFIRRDNVLRRMLPGLRQRP